MIIKYSRKILFCGICVLFLLGAIKADNFSDSLTSDSPRPNILFVLSDDQSWPHAGIYGTDGIRTPAFDRVAREGVLFTNAFAGAPQCSPNRAAVLTGRNIWQLKEAGTQASHFPIQFQVFPDLLEKAGYHIGYTGKGWGPPNGPKAWEYSGRSRNPAGPVYNAQKLQKKVTNSVSKIDYVANFQQFIKDRDGSKPFFFWVGVHEPHRGYEKGTGLQTDKNLEDARVPPFLPEVPEIQSDILDYYLEIEWFDQQLSKILKFLEHKGELDNTLVVVTSDNGMPFPRAKANLYEYGTHVPLAIRWPEKISGGRIVHDLTSSIDLAPTFLEVAEVDIPKQVSGTSLLNILSLKEEGYVDISREFVLTGRERHTTARPDNLGYPSRAIRTQEYLYIWNIESGRWPAGNPSGSGDPPYYYHDIDDSPSKIWMIENQNEPEVRNLFNLAFDKRPEEELYDIRKDPGCIKNLAGEYEVREIQEELRTILKNKLTQQNDPRVYGYEVFEGYPKFTPLRDFPGFKKRGEYNFEYY